MNRNLNIIFLENGNVKYKYDREPGFSRYTIEYPYNKTKIYNEQELLNWNFQKTISDQGLISFFRNREEIKKTCIIYSKNGYLEIIQNKPKLFRYKESLQIKYDSKSGSSYTLSIHGRDRRISAVKNRSRSVFIAHSDGIIHACQAFFRYSHGDKLGHYSCSEHKINSGETLFLKPTELAHMAFYCKGILFLDWVLEINEYALIQDI